MALVLWVSGNLLVVHQRRDWLCMRLLLPLALENRTEVHFRSAGRPLGRALEGRQPAGSQWGSCC